MAKKYRKKPEVVEAMQMVYGKTDVLEVEKFIGDKNFLRRDILTGQEYIGTLVGDVLISDGDYIIKGVQGEFYPCKPDVFKKNYEPVIDSGLVHAVVRYYGFSIEEAEKLLADDETADILFTQIYKEQESKRKVRPIITVNPTFTVKQDADISRIVDGITKNMRNEISRL